MDPRVDNDTVIYRVPTCDYITFVQLYWASLLKYYYRFNRFYAADYEIPGSFFADIYKYCVLNWWDVTAAFVLTIFWTLIRARLTKYYFLPWANNLGLMRSQTPKIPETLWKLGFYSCTWCVSLYLLILSGKYIIFFDPLSVWDDWHPSIAIPVDIRCVYILQGSFYLHSLYATFYMDVWRKDSIAMVIHHLLTVALITFSYGMRHHLAGMIVLLLHDISDVLLEFTKLNTYMKVRNGQTYLRHEWAANLGFVLFACSWFGCRLYLFPLKVMYTGMYGSSNMADHRLPGIPLFNGMLLMLLLMNTWWFHFILLLLYRVATGTLKEVDDTRDFEEAAEQELKQNEAQTRTLASQNQQRSLQTELEQNGDVRLRKTAA